MLGIFRTSDMKALYAEVDVEVAMLMKDSITSSRGFQEWPPAKLSISTQARRKVDFLVPFS